MFILFLKDLAQSMDEWTRFFPEWNYFHTRKGRSETVLPGKYLFRSPENKSAKVQKTFSFLWCLPSHSLNKKYKLEQEGFPTDRKPLLQRFATTSRKNSRKTFSSLLFSASSQVFEIVVEIHPLQRLVAGIFFLSCSALNTFFRQKLFYRFLCFTYSGVSLSTAKKLFFSISHSNPAISLLRLRINIQFSQRQHTRVMKLPEKKVENHRHGECKKRKSTWRKENGEKSMQRPRK